MSVSLSSEFWPFAALGVFSVSYLLKTIFHLCIQILMFETFFIDGFVIIPVFPVFKFHCNTQFR